jgi:hypothetical protein
MKGGGNIGSRAICATMPIGADKQMPLNQVLECKPLKSLIRIPLPCLAHQFIDDITDVQLRKCL